MFTFAVLYSLIYFQLLLLIFYFLSLYVNFNTLQESSVVSIITFNANYCSNYNQFTLLFLLLSGLPPVSFFLVKLSFLIKLFSTLSLFIQLLFFINFLLGMLFYLQVFNITVKNFCSTNMLLKTNANQYSILKKSQLYTQQNHYTYWYLYVLILMVNVVGIVVFFDFYLICSTIFN